MKVSINSVNLPASKEESEKKVNPRVQEAMGNYQVLKKQLYEHFFEGGPLSISNRSFSDAYTDLYNLLNDSSFVIQNDKQHFESVEHSFLNIYKKDLRTFAGRVYEQMQRSKGLQAEDQVGEMARWINIFGRFNHWIFKMFMILERNAMMAQGIKLYFEGIKILKELVFDRSYEDIYRNVYQTLELFKDGKLNAFEPLQTVIKYIGVVGFTKFKLVEMVKTRDGRFEYSSKKEPNQPAEHPSETGYFKTKFLSRLVKDLKLKYSQLVVGMAQLSTPEYFEKARYYIEKEEATADLFYGHGSVKQTVIRYVLETLIVERAESLLQNPKSGLVRLMQERDIENMVKIYSMLKKANMQRVFFREFQGYITGEGESILGRMSPQEEKGLRKEAIQSVIGEVIEFNEVVDTLRSRIDIHDAELQKAQNSGFQTFCNVNNRVCTYLAYYADFMLKKDDQNSHSDQLVQQVNKISKYLYSYDYFINQHQKLLGLRILYDYFKNHEAQFALINMLKNEAGINATSKISNMIQDQKSSEGWNMDFHLKNKFDFRLDVMMLTSGSWEINDPKCGHAHVPPELLPAVTQFEGKFLERMPNRSVSWIFTHGRAVVQFVPASQQKYILMLNNYQLLTLLHLRRNGYVPSKYGDLLATLKIEDEPFYKNSLMSLLKIGVLVKTGPPVKIQSKNDQVQLNLDFKFKTGRVGCSITPKYTEKTAAAQSSISAERQILIDAALVKIMKQRRKAAYQEVIVEVQKMCRTFKAEIQQIKVRIQNCQQRDFLERDPNDMNILIYKP